MAGFIGSANLLPAVVSAGSTPSAPKVDLAMGATIDVQTVGDAPPGEEVTVMVRPERMVPQEGEPQAGRSFVGEIKDVIYQGSEIRLIVDLDDRHRDRRRRRARPRHRADDPPGTSSP